MSAPKFKAGDVVQVPREIDTRTITARGNFNYLYHSTNAAADKEWLIDTAWLDKHGTLVEPVTVVDALFVVLTATNYLHLYRVGMVPDRDVIATVTSYSDGTVRYEELPKDGAL